jgi:hypothetical protein
VWRDRPVQSADGAPGLRLPGGGLKSAPEITGADVVYDLRRFDLEHTVRWLRTVA